MKILFLTNHIKGNDGWSRYARDLARVFVREGHEVECCVHELVTTEEKLDVAVTEHQCLGAPLPYLANPIRAWKSAKKVNEVIAALSPDIIHIIVEPYGSMLPFLKTGHAKIVITAHSTFAFFPILVAGWLRKFFATWITRQMYQRAQAVICVSKYTQEHLVRHMTAIGAEALVAEKIRVIAGGVDVAGVAHIPKQTPNNPREILFVGAVKQRKGVREAIDALAHVKSNFIFRIVGSYRETDPYIALVKEKIAAHKLGEKVVFEGKISDQELFKRYDAADLFMMLSTNNGADFEGYGLVYIEANAHGVPAIGPNDSGVSDAIVDGKTGYVVNQYDAPAVAQKIDDILQRGTISSADCIRWAHENSIEKKGAQVLALYAAL